jgi:cysteinyl-tRNA synthetase
MALHIYNTLAREKQDFTPLTSGKVGMYVCGMTVYDLAHIGHARCYVAFDVIRRWLQTKFDVTYVQNFTDVDDKIIARANERGEDPLELAARFCDEFHSDMDDLGILRADVEPKVTTHMQEIVDFVADLEKREFAYRVPSASSVDGAGDDVYFRVRRFDEYTALSGRNLEDMESGARVGVDERKEDPLDFALWKSAKEGEPFWESPWGKGRPGWHIECSAMSAKHLGETFDIHGGGKDLVFPHHTNEIAQSRCRSDTAGFAKTWMHNGFVNFAGEKMSKSLGNFFTIREVTARYHPEALRYFMLTAHYRSPINFDVQAHCHECGEVISVPEQEALKCNCCGKVLDREQLAHRVVFPGLEEAEARSAYVYKTLRRVAELREQFEPREGDDLSTTFSSGDKTWAPWDQLVAGMDDDFNTPQALAAVSDMLKVANALCDANEKELIGRKLKAADRSRVLAEWSERMEPMLSVLGLGQRDAVTFLADQRERRCRVKGIDADEVETLIADRASARADKRWEDADAVRDKLTAMGVEVRDGKEGVEWSVA